jgi:hypothetical protein
MAQVGRISGGILFDNLERQGVNLNFKNTIEDTPLLHFDVNSMRLGINKDAPLYDLDVNGSASANFLESSSYITAANITIENNSINANIGNLFFNSSSNIKVSTLATDDIKLDLNTISTRTENTNLELRPDGTGEVNVRTNLNVTGNLHATGDITFNGNFTLGDSNTDAVEFFADLTSDIVPDLNNTYNLGSAVQPWTNVYSDLLNGQRIELSELVINGTSLGLRQGNIFYVSTLGNDSNVGDHQHSAFRTLKHALSVVDASIGGPVTIHVFPGEYSEEFPLTVPENVTISGEDLRNTIIKPAAGYETQSVFLLNQNTTVENITVKDFYSPGYAFGFAPGAVIAERSPYVRNISVITQGSVTSVDDPRGFNEGDAGKGALIDGSILAVGSPSASMLFHSATFITPGVDCITMTNGVRVEWLNSFTYFASRGLYALDGPTGRISQDGSTIVYGAEIRSIGSASVYGNYGAVAAGADTLMYLIGHNFAYIGAGKDSSNDNTLTVQDNETIELNSGRIYYTSTDATGDFRVGNAFYVDFEKGTTSIDASNIDLTGLGRIFIRSGEDTTYIDGSRVDTGNIRFSGNTVSSLAGDIILKPSTEILNLDTNPSLTLSNGPNNSRIFEDAHVRFNTQSNLFEGYSTANLSFGGIYSDNRLTSVRAHPTNNTHILTTNNVVTMTVVDSGLQLNGLFNDDVFFNNNSIVTTLSNSDLELRRSGNAVAEIFDLSFNDRNIVNLSNDKFSIQATGQGYVKFNGSTGLVVPYGTTSERPVAPVVGDTRWNTETSLLETYNGTTWQTSSGEGVEVTEELMKEFVDIYTLVLG